MKSKVIYVPVTEWDLGLFGQTYTTRQYAMDAIRDAHDAQNMGDSFEDCWDDGFYSVEEWILYG